MHAVKIWGTAAAAAFLAPLALVAPAAHAAVVFDNVNPDAVMYQPLPIGQQVGDDVTLGAGPRQVTKFSLLIVNNTDSPFTGNFTATFYQPDQEGLPGATLWRDTVRVTNGAAGDQLISWDVPGVTVPDSFIWGLSIDSTSTDIGPYLNDTPTVGSSANYAYYDDGDGTGWYAYSYTPDSPDLANFAARIEASAVPEPGVCGLVGLAGAGLLGARRRRPRA